jgi:catechol 2,3-dioxygenase-like lactoylglutathione lyase family enzyme
MPPQLQHVSIPIPPDGSDAARAFYTGILQLEEIAVPREVKALDAAWFRLGDAELHLFFEEMQADRSARHFCIAVDDIDDVRARLEREDVPVVGATPLPDRPRLFCRDPFGNLIEITSMGFGHEGESSSINI